MSLIVAVAVGLVACGREPIVIEKEVIKEVEVPVIVEKEVIKEVEVPGETIIVEKEVVKIVEVEKPTGTTFAEAPVLASQVQAGKLPPVEERLPIASDVMLVPTEEIGRYGGTWRRAFNGVNDHWAYGRPSYSGLVRWNLELTSQIPYIAKSWEVSDGGKLYTFHLRKGMKWSDGHPHTADDWVYQHEDVMANEELTPNPPFCQSSPKGGLAEITKIDDYTFTLRFAQPNYTFVGSMCYINVRGGSGSPLAPAHYMKQFHKDYADPDELAAMIKEGGFDDWTQLYREMDDYMLHPERPSVRPWVLKTPITAQRVIAERNPYYFGVDREGNQLPYIDRMVLDLVPDSDIINVRAAQGDLDFQARHIKFSNYATLKENEDKGGYRIVEIQSAGTIPAGVYINLAWEGPEAQYLNNLDFRKGLSHAIDRDEINEILFFGLGEPRNAISPRTMPFWPGEDIAFKNTGYDLDLANELLDKAGLSERDDDGYRLRSDGKRLEINMVMGAGDHEASAEIVVSNLKDVGLAINTRVLEWGAFGQMRVNNELELVYDPYNWGTNEGIYYQAASLGIPYLRGFWAQKWTDWFTSNGERGEEPPAIIREAIDEYWKVKENLDWDVRAASMKRITEIAADNLWTIGIMTHPGYTIMYNAELQNVPTRFLAYHRTDISRPQVLFF
jgi:peptide/nickel transport system substrate-binding protein